MKRKVLFLICIPVLMASCVPSQYRSGWFASGGGQKQIVTTAKRYIGVRYQRGGTSPSGFDCSGYVWYVYKKNGISLPRTADQQYHSGRRINLRQARPGDLVFFHTSGRKVSHVGIYLGQYRFIHAPSSGKSVSVSDMREKYWKKKYAGAVHVVRRNRS